jgi:hypothetical protein
MTDLIAYDSTRPALIPADAAGILVYGDGKFEWTAEDLARFPKARRRSITVTGDPSCNILDVENGDARPSDVPNFLRAWKHEHPHGEDGTIYCSRDTLAEVQLSLYPIGLTFNLWLATLDGSQPRTIENPATSRLVAVQYAGGPDADYDVSVVYDRSWLRRPA